MNASGVMRRLMRKYDTMENRNAIPAKTSARVRYWDTEEGNSDYGVCNEKRGRAVKTICSFFDHCWTIFQERRNICNRLEVRIYPEARVPWNSWMHLQSIMHSQHFGCSLVNTRDVTKQSPWGLPARGTLQLWHHKQVDHGTISESAIVLTQEKYQSKAMKQNPRLHQQGPWVPLKLFLRNCEGIRIAFNDGDLIIH